MGLGVVIVRVPPHTGTLALPDTKPAGNTSVNPMPVIVVPEFGLVIVNVSVDGFPTDTDVGENVFVIDGGAACDDDIAGISAGT